MSEQGTPVLQPDEDMTKQPVNAPPNIGEQGEIVRHAAQLSVQIDKAMLDSISIATPEPTGSMVFRTSEDAQAEIDAKKSELEGVIDKIKRLPEKLDFQPGITLIVGENGGGKSTLARAISLVGIYQSRVESAIEYYRTHDIHEDEQQTDEELRDKAFRDVFQPRSGSDAERLAMAGVGAYIAPAMIDGTIFTSGHRVNYVDAGEAYGRAQVQTKENLQDRTMAVPEFNSSEGKMTTGIITIKGEGSFHVKSTRQTVDTYLEDYRRFRSSSQTGGEAEDVTGNIEFIDEPETGLSPRRHQKIEEEIYDVFGKPEEGNIIIVPTNSVVLFQSDLPRIDLDYPERGIHRPSEYPDHDGVAA